MKHLTIGKKIALGFGALIANTTLPGGIAVFNLKTVQTQDQTQAPGYLPRSAWLAARWIK